MAGRKSLHVMPALVAGIHVFLRRRSQDVDGRDKPGHDDWRLRPHEQGAIKPHGKTRPDLRKTAFRPAQRRVFRRLCQAGVCRARTGDALGRDRRPRNRRPFRAAEDAMAAAGGGAAAGTGHAGVAGRGPDGAGNPAFLRRHPAAGQPLLRLERGRPAGAAAGAAVAPGPAHAPPARRTRRRWRRSPKPCPRSRTRNCAPRWRGSAPRSSEIEPFAPARPRATRHCHNCAFQASEGFFSYFFRA